MKRRFRGDYHYGQDVTVTAAGLFLAGALLARAWHGAPKDFLPLVSSKWFAATIAAEWETSLEARTAQREQYFESERTPRSRPANQAQS
jgi:hypothetical protein